MGLEPGFSLAPLRPARLCFEHVSVDVVRPPVLRSVNNQQEDQLRSIGLDIHRDFCEVAIAEDGEVRSPGRIEMTPEALELFAGSLARGDQVALEVSGNAWEVVRIIRPQVGRVVVVSPADTGIRAARAKTDRLDARALAKLLAAGSLQSVWVPDDGTRAMRRRLQRRRKLLVVRTKAKNEIHAALMRRLVAKPAVSDLFGKQGRRWLDSLELPDEEQETVEGCLRQLDFCESEIAAIDKRIATEALCSPEIRRLMTVPGVNVICAATFMAAVGDIHRFRDRRKLVGYLGLDPKVRQSGLSATARGRISKQGSAPGRHALVEASWSVVKAPGPMHSYYQRIRARRGAQVAIVATSRKLACLFWCLLTREQDYAYAQPSLTAKKLRRLELAAGAPKGTGGSGVWSTNKAMREAEQALARQAEAAYERTVADWQRQQRRRKGANATTGRAN
jgi:transposase